MAEPIFIVTPGRLSDMYEKKVCVFLVISEHWIYSGRARHCCGGGSVEALVHVRRRQDAP